MRVYLLIVAVAFVVSASLTPLVRSIGARTMADIPLRARDMHAEHIPKLGGVAMIAGLLAALGVASQSPFLAGVFTRPDLLMGLVLACLLILVLGVADDLFDLRWYFKLAGQVGAALIMAVSGVRLEVLPVGWWHVAEPGWQIALSVFLMVLTMNAINFVDGLDGLAAGIAAIGSGAFFVYCYALARDVNQYDHSNLGALLMAMLFGASLGFLVHNFNPAKIFMGETGAMVIGLIMAVAAIAVTTDVQALDRFRFRNVPAYMPILLPIAVIILPLLDLVLSIVRRTARGKSPFSADRGHLHHKLVDGGYTHRGAVLLLYLWSSLIAFGTVALSWVDLAILLPIWGALLLGAALLTLSPWIRRRLSQRSLAKARRLDIERDGRL
ncbi:MraY family glycosyltransferase [Galactobacter caseinivorans]|uniref:Undecaprenyl/decaprenyl-phosphate alpha-N-acetylglucosaminyl 1-phosphate transferase n=1 Tax=Galactobacter caseinivorans TaxID=2676123 RepID=A0A496PMT7_9MICC|nr:MraY family glycosyltransferase [Galactobacter caseinivorans]RKW71851.1 undecaprenyl/decaprenyl-phosphate alpha-N-acetylglucosaminyl 1-phosphate transferase [Galactobacter caseinivorans]